MLSNTSGLTTFSRSLGFHRDTLSQLALPCPDQRKKGRCRAFQREQVERRQIAAAKEAELLAKATAMYNLQLDLLDEGGSSIAGLSVAEFGSVLTADPAKKDEVIASFLQELKQEPAYLNWSLDAAVAERLVELRIVHCPYSHRAEVQTVLKRSRADQTQELLQLEPRQEQELRPGGDAAASRRRRLISEAAWLAERRRIFSTLTPLQRCVVCLLWQRAFDAPRNLLGDVRRELEKLAESAYEQQHQQPSSPPQGRRHGASPVLFSSEVLESEESLDAYLASPAFQSLVEAEAAKIVTQVVFRPDLGVIDLSHLPTIVAHLSTTQPSHRLLNDATLQYFMGELAADGTPVGEDQSPQRRGQMSAKKQRHVLFESRPAVSAKEVELSGAAQAEEVVEAIEWSLHVYYMEGQLSPSFIAGWAAPQQPGATEAANYTTALFQRPRVILHGLTIKNASITSADALVLALHKRKLADFLYSLDLSENRLWSLRFLMVLRAHYAKRLLRLSLHNNPITRKPEYQEQVRLSLPQLTSLDGQPIRCPPLRLPKPLSWRAPPVVTPSSPAVDDKRNKRHKNKTDDANGSDTADTEAQRRHSAEQDAVLDCVRRLFYCWEARRVPHTAAEVQAFLHQRRDTRYSDDKSDDEDGAAATASTAAVELPPEEEVNEDNFPHRYLHPNVSFTLTMAPGLHFFDAATMQDRRIVELDDSYSGMRLNAADVRDLRVFDVAMKSGSRNLLTGRSALQRYGRGAENCFMAYRLTLYPERMEVDHHLAGATVSMLRLEDPSMVERARGASQHVAKKAKNQKGNSTAVASQFGAEAGTPKKPTLFVVNLHGLMTWRLPSMRGTECIEAAYSRVMILTRKVLPVQNREWERRRSPPYVLVSDQIQLYPAPPPLSMAIYAANTTTRLARLVVEMGLEICRDGVALVRDTMERSTSQAAEYAALHVLVFGTLGEYNQLDAELSAVDKMRLTSDKEAEEAFAALLQSYSPPLPSAQLGSTRNPAYTIFSALEGPSRRAVGTDAAELWCPASPRVVTQSLLYEVTSISNRHFTALAVS